MRKPTSLIIFFVTICLFGGYTRCSGTTKPQKKEQQPTAPEKKVPPRPYKKFEQMNLEEAREAAEYFRVTQNDTKLALVLERVIILTGEPEELSVLMHELAPLHEKLENYEEAGTVYEQYARLFPGNPDVNYMTYKMLEILSKQIRDVLHDQSKIKHLAEQTDIFLERFGQHDKHAKWVTTLRNHGYQLLTQSEIARARFYLDRYSYTKKSSALNAAGKRLEEAEKILVNLDLGEKDHKAVEEAMDAIRAENFETLPDEEKIARTQKAITVIAQLTGEETEQKATAASFFKRFF